jgi:hypothetical protein
VRIVASALILILLTVPVRSQKPQSTATLRETFDWMSHFAGTHGHSEVDDKFTEENRILGLEGCSVAVMHKFVHMGNTAHDLKETEDFMSLSDMNPDVRIQHERGNVRVQFERSDSARKIKHNVTLGDGRKLESYTSEDYMYFDSEDSANRFANALIHAITLCGGKPAPF